MGRLGARLSTRTRQERNWVGVRGGRVQHGRRSSGWSDGSDIVSFAVTGSVVNVLTKSKRKVVLHWAGFGTDLHSSL